MKLRDLKHGGVSAWPPAWGGSYGAGDTFAIGEVGVLKAVEPARGMAGVHIEIEYEGRSQSGVMQWDGDKPSTERLVEVLVQHLGEKIRSLRDVELD